MKIDKRFLLLISTVFLLTFLVGCNSKIDQGEMVNELDYEIEKESNKLHNKEEIDTDKTDEELVNEIEEEPDALYDNANSIGNTSGNLANGGCVAIQDDWIFYVIPQAENNYLYKEKIDGTEKVIIHPEGLKYITAINVVGDWVYFINSATTSNGEGLYATYNIDEKLYRMKIDGTELTQLSQDNIYYIVVVNDTIYYVNQSDNSRIYKMKTDGTDNTLINNDKSRSINVIDDWIYYINYSDDIQDICKVKTDGTNKQSLEKVQWGRQLMVYQDKLYFIDTDDNFYDNISSIDLDGNNRTHIIKDVSSYNISNNMIFYSVYDKGTFSSEINGSNKEKLSIDDSWNINIWNNWIFYYMLSGYNEDGFVINQDGSARMKLTKDVNTVIVDNLGAPQMENDNNEPKETNDDIKENIKRDIVFEEEFKIDNWNITINKYKFNDKITVDKKIASTYIEAEDSMTYLVLYMEVENLGTESKVLFDVFDSEVNIELTYNKQYNYDNGRSDLDTDLSSIINEIKPLQKKTGIVFFEVPTRIASSQNELSMKIYTKDESKVFNLKLR